MRLRSETEPDNLIVNGSFEQDGSTSNISPSAWQLAGSRLCTLSNEGATEGDFAAVFGDGTADSKPPTAHTASISQTVATRPGVRYRLSFDYAVYGSSCRGTRPNAGGSRCRQPAARRADVFRLGHAPASFQPLKLEFLADGPSATVTFSDSTANGESGLADGVLDNVELVELSPEGNPLVAVHSTGADDPEHLELLALLLDADSPTNVTPNDAVDFYLYDSPIHDRIMALRTRLNEAFVAAKLAPARAHVLAERLAPYDPRIFVRGDPSRRGPEVPRRFWRRSPAPIASRCRPQPRRLELARAIADPANPLTARVLVNRVWLHHFGAGLVASPSNFGLRSDPPSHPELLDYLTWRFVAEGWSIKQLHRWMMLSSTYQQSSADRPDAVLCDPENRLLSRMNRQRLDFESLRDAMLAAAGRLDRRGRRAAGRSCLRPTAAGARSMVWSIGRICRACCAASILPAPMPILRCGTSRPFRSRLCSCSTIR